MMEAQTIAPVRILQVFGSLNLGGAESRMMDLYRAIDRTRVQFDFLVHTEEKGFFEDEIVSLGGDIFRVPRFRGNNPGAYREAMRALFAAHRGTWKMVQGHMTSTAAIYLPLAKEYGDCITIAHARSAGTDPGLKGVATGVLRAPLRTEKTCDLRFAVSTEAAVRVFGKRLTEAGAVRVIPNAINTDAYAYDAALRETVRRKLRIRDNHYVIGHVGRFHYAKNHEHLLRVFAAAKTLAADVPMKLLLIGDGPLLEEMKDLAAALDIAEDVIFAGVKTPVAPYYQAMDLFVFPSHYEGLPGTLVEAEASGLSCLISHAITKETDVDGLVTRLDRHRAPAQWAKVLLDLLARTKETDRNVRSKEAREALKKRGFDTVTQAGVMTEFYETGHF